MFAERKNHGDSEHCDIFSNRYWNSNCRGVHIRPGFMVERRIEMKGYYISSGYMGWIGTRWMLFASDTEYKEWMEDIYG